MQNSKPLLVSEALPEFSVELQELLTAAGQSSLAAAVPTLRIVDRCRCGDGFCATFYTQPKPKGAYGPGHGTIELEPKQGMLILDIVNGVIACVEALQRNELRKKLLAMFP